MHACQRGSRCLDPCINRWTIALEAVRAEFEVAHARAREAWERYESWPLSPDQVQMMAIALAWRQGEQEDLPCTELAAVVRRHLESDSASSHERCGQAHPGPGEQPDDRLRCGDLRDA